MSNLTKKQKIRRIVETALMLALSTILKFSSDGIFGITNESVNDSFIFAKISSLF